MISLIKSAKPDNILSLISAFLFFIKCRPYFVWEWSELSFAIISTILLSIFIFKVNVRAKRKKTPFIIIVSAYILISFLRGAHFGFLSYLLLAFIPFADEKFLNSVYEWFICIIAVTFAISILSLVAVLGGLQQPVGILDALNDVKDYSYIEYFMLVIPTHVNVDSARFCSVFDEPGVVGTLSALVLIAENFNFKDKKLLVVLVAGIFSFSLFFYLIIVIYLLLRAPAKYKIVTIISVFFLYLLTINNEVIYDRIWARLEIGSDGLMEGDNRNTESLIALWDRYKYSPQILLGYGAKFVSDYTDSASIQLFILRDGLLFVILFLLSLYKLARYYISNFNEVVIIMIIMLCTLYQRPGFCETEYLLLFSIIIIKHQSYDRLNNRG